MRNIFDQYSQPENKLTHALVCCLSEDRKLLKKFIRWSTGTSQKHLRNLEILEQRLPGEQEVSSEEEVERSGLPDAWIHDGNKWSVIIESKVSAKLSANQLRRHYETAQGRGFEDITLLVIDTEPKKRLPEHTCFKLWSEVYSWLVKQSQVSQWAEYCAEYFQIAERRMVADGYLKEGKLTVFSGIPFNENNPYNYLEAKRLLRLIREELVLRKDLQREVGMDPAGQGRSAITGLGKTSVWDFLRLKQAEDTQSHTKFSHLTFSIQHDRLYILITVPNGIKSKYRRNLLKKGEAGFLNLFEEINKNLSDAFKKINGAIPWVQILQRHYLSQRSNPIVDASLAFDLRTAFTTKTRRGSKGLSVTCQSVWLKSAYSALSPKRGNVQLEVGAIFPYASCEAVKTPEILDHIASVWIACRPLLKTLLG